MFIYLHTTGGFYMPVSYTHLRAHETDSYLVCRLLLEKKKKTRKKKKKKLKLTLIHISEPTHQTAHSKIRFFFNK